MHCLDLGEATAEEIVFTAVVVVVVGGGDV
jgi:hypothetical protein